MTHDPIDPMEILLVEDNDDDDIILTEEAFAVARVMNSINSVRDGEAALAYLRQEGPYKDAVRPGLVPVGHQHAKEERL